jgi:hypothetical protein
MNKNKLNLRNTIAIAICLVVSTAFVGCENEPERNFHNFEHRIGLWINAERNDTLKFINSSELIRKGTPISFVEYRYRVEDNVLFVWLPNFEVEESKSAHPILRVEGNTVVLGNMYPVFGFGDSSGTFVRQ